MDLPMETMPTYCPFCERYGFHEYLYTKAFDEDVIEYHRCKFCGKKFGI